MSRSGEATAALALAVCLGLAGPAYADQSSPPAPSDSSSRSTDPRTIRVAGQMPEPVDFPTHDLTSPTHDLTSPTHDLVLVSRDVEGLATQRESARELDVRLNSNVLFGKDSAVILPAAEQRLAEIGDTLAARGPGTVEIVGYTDDLGSAQHGLVLSRRRAQAVREALAPSLAEHEVRTEGRGEADPLVPNKDEKSRSLNRRVEIHFSRE